MGLNSFINFRTNSSTTTKLALPLEAFMTGPDKVKEERLKIKDIGVRRGIRETRYEKEAAMTAQRASGEMSMVLPARRR